MSRLTQKNDIFGYELPCQNVMGDTQAGEITIGDSEYTAKKYIIGEAIRHFGELEDVLETYCIEDLDKFIDNQLDEIYKLRQELAELKQKAIVPKFKVGQEIYYIYGNEIRSMFVSTIEISKNLIVYHSLRDFVQFEFNCFATREEAEQKLAEIKGEFK